MKNNYIILLLLLLVFVETQTINEVMQSPVVLYLLQEMNR